MLDSRSPAHPGQVLATFPDQQPDEVSRVVAAARQAAAGWAATPALARSQALQAAADALAGAAAELTEVGIAEVGKPRAEMTAEVARGVAILRYYAQAALDPDGDTLPSADGRSLLISRHRPVGVAGLITPWNFPVAIPLWKAAPALAYGNAVVWKPAPAATATGRRLAALLAGALPAGVLSLVTGNAAAGQGLVQSADVISFTGSAAVGRLVAVQAASRGIQAQAEMGGQNPAVILPGADLEFSARTIAQAAMGYAGQKCTATSRVIVVGGPAAAAEAAEALASSVGGLPVGDPAESATVVGPVISEAARQRVVDAAAEASAGGGRVLTGGDPVDGDGFFVRPVLAAGVDPSARIAQEEIFGPFAVILTARDDDEALRIANGVPYGLAASVFTTDLDRALRFAAELDAGLVRVNGPTSGVDFNAPFGGVKDSSIGPREQGKAARDFYTVTQTTTFSPGRPG
ncbi:MAG TPA: aldehyde dehydrogenase family protein [Streptosporangiaceae bacterium]|nr:aldehyde dehydrogenase family protein [Streptosporangiaceae bacterium]